MKSINHNLFNFIKENLLAIGTCTMAAAALVWFFVFSDNDMGSLMKGLWNSTEIANAMADSGMVSEKSDGTDNKEEWTQAAEAADGLLTVDTASGIGVADNGDTVSSADTAIQKTSSTDGKNVQKADGAEGTQKVDSKGGRQNNTVNITQTSATTETAETETQTRPTVPYTYYTPTQVNSRYFSDPGRTPATMEADYTTVDDSYFDDSLWIGDSRCMGIYDYSTFNKAEFYCDNGFCAYLFSKGKTVKHQGSGGSDTVEGALENGKYGKVYIMLGINDSGYGTTETFKEAYGDMIDLIKKKQPGAVIYLVGNMHISRSAEQKSDIFSNLNINDKNVAISELADGETSFYLDFNSLVTDENGYLKDDLTFDGYHLYAQGYAQIIDFFKTHAIVR